MEYFIGQEIELIHNKKTIKLKVEKDNGDGCENCFFSDNDGNCTRHDYSNMDEAFCSTVTRKDKNNIIYKQIK